MRHKKEQSVKNSDHYDVGHEDTSVVSKFVSKKSNYRRSYKDTKWKNGVDKSNINVTDTNILHVYGQIGKDCKGSTRKHKESAF